MVKRKKAGTRKRAHPSPAVKAALDILTLANLDDGGELTDAQQKDLFSKCEDTIARTSKAISPSPWRCGRSGTGGFISRRVRYL